MFAKFPSGSSRISAENAISFDSLLSLLYPETGVQDPALFVRSDSLLQILGDSLRKHSRTYLLYLVTMQKNRYRRYKKIKPLSPRCINYFFCLSLTHNYDDTALGTFKFLSYDSERFLLLKDIHLLQFTYKRRFLGKT